MAVSSIVLELPRVSFRCKLEGCMYTNVYNVNQISYKISCLNPLKTEFLLNNIKIQFVPHRKQYASATKSNRLMLFRETVAICSVNHTERINTLCGQN
jgi:hypothetical protein